MFLLLSSLALAVPVEMNHQGRLVDSGGVGLTGSHMLTFRIHDASTGGNVLWSEIAVANFDNGYYSIQLGQNTALDSTVLEQYPLWMEVQVDGNAPMTPRYGLSSVPFAFVSEVAEVAKTVEGYVDATEVAVNGTTVIDSNGNWVGPGMSNGGGNPDWTDVQNRPAGLDDGDDDSFANISCTSGEGLAYNGSGWTCVSLVGSFSDLSNIPSGLSDGDDDTLAGISCSSGEIIQWSGSSWVCSTPSAGGTSLTESDVENYVTNDPINLSSNSMMNGAILATQDDLSSMDWTDIQNKPVGLDNGDNDILGDLSCSAGETISFDGSDWVCVSSTVDFNNLSNIPSDLTDGDNDTLGALICSEGEVAVYSESVGGWVCGSNGGSSGSSIPNIIGQSDGGFAYTSLDTPEGFPNNNEYGFVSARAVGDAITINTFSLDLNITHEDMGEVTVILTSPEGTAITVYDGNHPGQANFNGNLGWDNAFFEGTLYSFYGEDPQGVWTLKVVDKLGTGDGGTDSNGTLEEWTLRLNEDWDGELFVGDNITVQEEVHVRGKMYVEYGAELIFLNTDGEETFKIASEDGKVTIGGTAGGSLVDNEEFIPQVFWVTGTETSTSGCWGHSNTTSATCPSGSSIITGRCNHVQGSFGSWTTNALSGETWQCRIYGCSATAQPRALCMNVSE